MMISKSNLRRIIHEAMDEFVYTKDPKAFGIQPTASQDSEEIDDVTMVIDYKKVSDADILCEFVGVSQINDVLSTAKNMIQTPYIDYKNGRIEVKGPSSMLEALLDGDLDFVKPRHVKWF